MTYEQLLSRISGKLPDTAGKLTIEKVHFNKETNKAVFSFLSEVLVGERGFMTVKQVIA